MSCNISGPKDKIASSTNCSLFKVPHSEIFLQLGLHASMHLHEGIYTPSMRSYFGLGRNLGLAEDNIIVDA